MDDEARHLTRQHLLSIKDEYFEQDQWYDALCSAGLQNLTFPSRFIDISLEEAKSLMSGAAEGLLSLTQKIEQAQQSLGAKRIFVKFLRSPKDASTVYDNVAHRLGELLALEKDRSIWQLFAEARQEAIGVATAADASALLRSSGRVCAEQASAWAPEGGDVWWAVHGSRFGKEFTFEQMRPRLMVRTFDHALPLFSEWRAFIWKRRCTGVSQYFYDFAFDELQGPDVRCRLLADLNQFLISLDPVWNSMLHEHAMLDFVWEPERQQPIVLIEINPFDPDKGLGHTSSLALFDWATDGEQLRTGTDIEVRIAPLKSQRELEIEFNRNWPTVGKPARDAMRRALNQLSSEDIEKSHFLTQSVARKLGFIWAVAEQTKSQGKGTEKGERSLGKGLAKGKRPTHSLPKSMASVTAAAPKKSLQEILAQRKQKADDHASTNLDVKRTKIREGLWLGNYQDAEDVAKLRQDGITHILNCARDVETPANIGSFMYLRLDLDDNEAASEQLLQALRSGAAFTFIAEGLEQGGVLVHCRLGRSRSASILIGFMVARLDCTCEEALSEVQQKRQLFGSTLVEPNNGFKRALGEFCAFRSS